MMTTAYLLGYESAYLKSAPLRRLKVSSRWLRRMLIE